MSARRQFEVPKSWIDFREAQMEVFHNRNRAPKRPWGASNDQYDDILQVWFAELPEDEKDMDNFDNYPAWKQTPEVDTWMSRFATPDFQAELKEVHPGIFDDYLTSTITQDETGKTVFQLTEHAMDSVHTANEAVLDEERPVKRR